MIRYSRTFIYLFLFLQLFFIFTYSSDSNNNGFYPDNIFSRGNLGYGPLLVDSKSTSLYVGAKGHLYRLWLFNINQTSSENLYHERKLETRTEEKEECLQENSETECDTWIRNIFLTNEGKLLLCTSSGMKPQLRTINPTKLKDDGYPRTVIGVCSPQQGLNTTAIYVNDGNPDGISAIYSGIRTGLTLENYLIYRPPLEFNNRQVHSALRTVYTDSKWLNEPQFVGSFDNEQYVYFFFREISVEAQSIGKIVYSRVARVCKRDLGGQNLLSQKWSTFVKARLNCSLNGQQFPYYFDHIQSIVTVKTSSDTIIYGTFSTAEGPFITSAVCGYTLSSINRVFDNGLFLEQQNGVWQPTIPDTIPQFRPGTCVENSKKLPDSDIHFAQSHLIMSDTIPSISEPLINDKRQYGKIIADIKDEDTIILYIYLPNENKLIKILHNRQEFGINSIKKLSEYKIPFNSKINYIDILYNEYLFIADNDRVSQYRLAQCSLHNDCGTCATDPHCSWNIARAECFSQETVHSTAVGWITNAKSAERCAAYVKSIAKTIYPGDSLYLECPGTDPQWFIDKQLIQEDTERIKMTKNGGLIILNATGSESGTYQCIILGTPVLDYLVRVDDEECTKPTTVEQFHSIQREWCRKFDNYKSSLMKWQRWYDNNSHCPRLPEELNHSSHHKKQQTFTF